MRVERFNAVDASRGIREINAKYGDDVLIISNARVGSNIQFVIAIDTDQRSQAVFKAESLVEDFKGSRFEAVSATNHNLESTVAEQEFFQDLKSFMQAGLDDIKAQLNELKCLYSKSKAHVIAHHESADERSASRLMRLMSGSNVPIDLLQKLTSATSSCELDIEYIAAVRTWLNDKLRDLIPMEKKSNIHFLVGAHGVGKTVLGIRLVKALEDVNLGDEPLFVSYKPGHDSALLFAQEIAKPLCIDILRVRDLPELVCLIDEHISSRSLIVELPANLQASELLRLQKRLPSAMFHLVIATDSQVHISQYTLGKKTVKFSSAMITGIDYHGVGWCTINTVIENDLPLAWGSLGGSTAQSLVKLDKQSVIDDLIRGMSEKINSAESERFKPYIALSKNTQNTETM